MEIEQTAGHSKDSKTAMQRSEKRSNDENCIASNEEDISVKRMKNVATDTDSDDKIEVKIHVPNDVAILKGLLLEKASNLMELHIDFEHHWSEKQDVTPVAHLFEQFEEFELHKLNVLRVQHMAKNDYGIVADILKVSPNLNSFEKFSKHYDDSSLGPECINVEELTMLQSLNKLHCLKHVSLSFGETLVEFLEKTPQFVNLPFESIIMSMNRLFTRYTSQDGEMISKLFCASKNSLLELNITPVGSIPGVELPRFENLKKLTMSHDLDNGIFMFPRDFDMVDSFPNLRELVIDILDEDAYFSIYQPSSVMPNVESLTILGHCKYDKTLMKMMPNVKTLVFDGEDGELPGVNFGAIAFHLTRLENLKLLIHVESPDELQSSCELDVMITGLSEQFCKKMSVQLRNVDELSASKIATYTAKREYASLLDLKGLKRLDIMLTMFESSDVDEDDDDECCDMAGFQSGSIFYKTGLTKVIMIETLTVTQVPSY